MMQYLYNGIEESGDTKTVTARGKEEISSKEKASGIGEAKGKRQVGNTAQASITVEAVFIIPVIILLFLMLLWFSFYLHDKAVIEGAIFEMLEEGGEYMIYGALPDVGIIEEEKGSRGNLRYAYGRATYEELKQWEKSLARKIKRKLFLYQIAGFSCDKTGGNIKVYAGFCCAKFFPAKWWGLSKLFYIEYDYDRLCPVREEVTRIGSVLLNLYENIMK